MRRYSITLFLCALAALTAGAQRLTTITASKLLNVDGSGVTGQLCLSAVGVSGSPQGFMFGSGGQGTTQAKCFSVTAGVLQSGVTVPDTSVSTPANLCLAATLTDRLAPASRNPVRTWSCLQPSGSSWSLDGQPPTGSYALPFFGISTSLAGNNTFTGTNTFTSPIVGHATLDLPLTGGTLTGALNTDGISDSSGVAIGSGGYLTVPSTGAEYFYGAATFYGPSASVDLYSNAAATSGANYQAPPLTWTGTYWNGSASATDAWTLQPQMGTGTNPTSNLTFFHFGSSGVASVTLPNPTTATTQTTGDSSTKVATDAFVGNTMAAYAPLASPSFTGTVTAPGGVGINSSGYLTVPSTGAEYFYGAATFYGPSASVDLYSNAAATSGANYQAPPLTWTSTYWNGSASATDAWTLQPQMGTGTNPTSNLTFFHFGSSGVASVTLPNPTTATTQTTGDSSTKVATDAFVGSTMAAYATLASPTFTGTVTAPTFSGSLTGHASLDAPLASPALTGTPTAPTQTTGDSSTKVATDAFVANTFAAPPAIGSGTSNDATFNNLTQTSSGGAYFYGQATIYGPSGGMLLLANQIATSGTNYQAPPLTFNSSYWNGSASSGDGWNFQPVLGSGTNPTSTLVLGHSFGTTGFASVQLPAVTIPSVAGAGTATFAAGAGAGTSPGTPTCKTSFVCDSIGGTVSLTTGTATPTTGTVVTFTFGTTRIHIPTCFSQVRLPASPYTLVDTLATCTTTACNINLTGAALSVTSSYEIRIACPDGN